MVSRPPPIPQKMPVVIINIHFIILVFYLVCYLIDLSEVLQPRLWYMRRCGMKRT